MGGPLFTKLSIKICVTNDLRRDIYARVKSLLKNPARTNSGDCGSRIEKSGKPNEIRGQTREVRKSEV